MTVDIKEFRKEISMEKNYYTPEISEFYVGFEAEWRMIEPEPSSERGLYPDEKVYKWTNHLIALEDFEWNCLYPEPHNIQCTDVEWRVKFLDKSDIEEIFGIENITFFDNYGSIFFYIVKADYEDFFNEVRYDAESNLMTIEYCKHSNTPERLSFANPFQGYIKNKSELVKLLQQLRIKTK